MSITKFMPRNAMRCLPPQAVKGSSLGRTVETPSLTWR